MEKKEGLIKGPRWYAVYTKKQREHFADLKLMELGIKTFLPLILTKVRRKWQLRPLFSCYIFAYFDASKWLYTINHLPGVNKVVSFNNIPIAVDPMIIEELKSRIGEKGYLISQKEYHKGDYVRIKGGLFDGYEGTIAEIRPRDRIVILLNAIVSRARLEITGDFIEVLQEYIPEE